MQSSKAWSVLFEAGHFVNHEIRVSLSLKTSTDFIHGSTIKIMYIVNVICNNVAAHLRAALN